MGRRLHVARHGVKDHCAATLVHERDLPAGIAIRVGGLGPGGVQPGEGACLTLGREMGLGPLDSESMPVVCGDAGHTRRCVCVIRQAVAGHIDAEYAADAIIGACLRQVKAKGTGRPLWLRDPRSQGRDTGHECQAHNGVTLVFMRPGLRRSGASILARRPPARCRAGASECSRERRSSA